ncbi:MAG: hypothetical protein WAZ34_10230 [Rhodocyclaceae bacterium]
MRAQRGAALLLFLAGILLATTYAVISQLSAPQQENARQTSTSAALAEAKDALLGFALSYREGHTNQGFGFLPCPDTNNDGQAEANCGLADVSVAARLPWQTLGLSPLRDGNNECLWYAVSGSAKDNPKTAAFNWDTPGQFIVQDAAGTAMAGATAHDRPLAVILAPGFVLGTQSHASAGSTECRGSNAMSDYLEEASVSADASATSTIRLSTADSRVVGSNNDRGLWIGSKELFERIKKRRDFKSDIDTLIDDLANHLNHLATASLPAASTDNKGVDAIVASYLAANPFLPLQKANVLNNWRDNLLYTKPASSATVNGTNGCSAVLLFSGERTTGQSRASHSEKLNPANYLEGSNATRFPASGNYAGNTHFDSAAASSDIVRCIKGSPTQLSFASNFSSFQPAGLAVSTDLSVPASPTLTIADAPGASGGCFWQPALVPLAGKTLRAYYEFQFAHADSFALGSGASDRGSGFTFQIVRGDFGEPTACGSETALGTLNAASMWGSLSFIVETDIRKDTTPKDPSENHSAILLNGSLTHATGTMNSACNGTTSGCRHSPANKFEESPAPLAHNQRIEIHTGCNSGCSSCNPENHAAPNTYARITAWLDCSDCTDAASDLDRTAKVPTLQRCTLLVEEMNAVHFGLTAGFQSTADTLQHVTFRNLILRSD